MADNITTPGVGSIIATDQVGSIHHPLEKVGFGDQGNFQRVTEATPLPVADRTVVAFPMTAVPTTSGAAVLLTGKPTGAQGVELYVDDGESLSFTIAGSTAPTGAIPSYTLAGPAYLPLALGPGQQVYKTALTGSPAYRFV